MPLFCSLLLSAISSSQLAGPQNNEVLSYYYQRFLEMKFVLQPWIWVRSWIFQVVPMQLTSIRDTVILVFKFEKQPYQVGMNLYDLDSPWLFFHSLSPSLSLRPSFISFAAWLFPDFALSQQCTASILQPGSNSWRDKSSADAATRSVNAPYFAWQVVLKVLTLKGCISRIWLSKLEPICEFGRSWIPSFELAAVLLHVAKYCAQRKFGKEHQYIEYHQDCQHSTSPKVPATSKYVSVWVIAFAQFDHKDGNSVSYVGGTYLALRSCTSRVAIWNAPKPTQSLARPSYPAYFLLIFCWFQCHWF